MQEKQQRVAGSRKEAGGKTKEQEKREGAACSSRESLGAAGPQKAGGSSTGSRIAFGHFQTNLGLLKTPKLWRIEKHGAKRFVPGYQSRGGTSSPPPGIEPGSSA